LVTEPVGAPLSLDAAALYLGKTTSLLPAGASVGAAPLSNFANMCNLGVGIAGTGSVITRMVGSKRRDNT
jgi:hypothetical protein